MKIKQRILKLILKMLRKDLFDISQQIVCYVCGQEALPSPLSSEEEKIYIERLAQHDEEAKAKLIEHNLRLVVYISKRFESSGVDLDDLISVGAIGLIKAVQSFNLDKNIKLATYASKCIENEILMHLRKVTKRKCEVSLDEPLNYDKDGNELLLADLLSTEGDTVSKDIERTAEKQLLWNAIQKLNYREQQIMTLRFGLMGNEESTQKEVADMLSISQSYISRIEKKILNRLKKDLIKNTV